MHHVTLYYKFKAMKSIAFISVILLFSAKSFAQRLDSAAIQKLSPENQALVQQHLKNSKNLKIGAFSSLGLGVIFGTIGVAQAAAEVTKVFPCAFGACPDPIDENKGSALAITGTVLALGSIPLFIVSGSEKRKAYATAFSNPGISLAPGLPILPNTASTGISIVIPISR